MRKHELIYLILLVTALFSFAGCKSKEDKVLQSYIDSANSYNQNGDYEEAIKIYREALDDEDITLAKKSLFNTLIEQNEINILKYELNAKIESSFDLENIVEEINIINSMMNELQTTKIDDTQILEIKYQFAKKFILIDNYFAKYSALLHFFTLSEEEGYNDSVDFINEYSLKTLNELDKNNQTKLVKILAEKILGSDKIRSDNITPLVEKKLADANAIIMSTKTPEIGMTKEEARQTLWGSPQKVNTTETKNGISEQWVYKNNKYLYFENGILKTIQK